MIKSDSCCDTVNSQDFILIIMKISAAGIGQVHFTQERESFVEVM